MLSGIGVDIIEISRFEHIQTRFGERFSNRILTTNELLQYESRGQDVRFLASRFAAKEAVSKALGTGIAKGITFQSIEIINDTYGKPELVFYGAAKALILGRNITASLLSLSDEKKYVVAMVVLESG